MKITVSAISPGNASLAFIDKRVTCDDYRGSWSSQHNRYTMDDVEKILTLFNKYAPDGKKMTIRNTDISKRPNNTPEEAIYAKFCDDTKKITGIGTQDAMRKNLFVDFHRMGFINRFNRNGDELAPLEHGNIRFVSLSKQGLKLINAKTILDKFFIFSKGVDYLLGGFINLLLEVFRNPEYGIDNVTIYEFMFFVSATHSSTTFSIDTQECVDLIKSYRQLSTIQRRSVLEILKTQLIPHNFTGSKTGKRDFHNWWNKAEQIYILLNQTVYFEQRDEKLVPKIIKGADDEESVPTKLSRSVDEKYQYFQNHSIQKIAGFELHHVVPLSWSENIHQFKLLDKWLNMVYIDGFNHGKITQNNNRNVVMENDAKTIILSDYTGNKVVLEFRKNVVYSHAKIVNMLDYNKELLKMY